MALPPGQRLDRYLAARSHLHFELTVSQAMPAETMDVVIFTVRSFR
jgi:hypothetical protein